VDQIVDTILALPEQTRITLMAPVVRGRKGEHQKIIVDARRAGFVRIEDRTGEYHGSALWCTAPKGGFDLDAVSVMGWSSR